MSPSWQVLRRTVVGTPRGTVHRLPTYANTALGDSRPEGLSSPEGHTEFNEQCHDRFYEINGLVRED